MYCRALLAEKGAHAAMRWSKLKESMAKDKRYRAMPREQREPIFKAFVAEKQVSIACHLFTLLSSRMNRCAHSHVHT